MHALPDELVDWVVSREGLVFLSAGHFDDREAGVTGFTTPELVDELRQRHAER